MFPCNDVEGSKSLITFDHHSLRVTQLRDYRFRRAGLELFSPCVNTIASYVDKGFKRVHRTDVVESLYGKIMEGELLALRIFVLNHTLFNWPTFKAATLVKIKFSNCYVIHYILLNLQAK